MSSNFLSFIKREDVSLSLFPHSKVLEILFSEQMEHSAARDPLLTRGISLTELPAYKEEKKQENSWNLLANPAKIIAKNLTVIEFNYFKTIKFDEFLGQAWSKKGSEWKAPHILSSIKRFNEVSGTIHLA